MDKEISQVLPCPKEETQVMFGAWVQTFWWWKCPKPYGSFSLYFPINKEQDELEDNKALVWYRLIILDIWVSSSLEMCQTPLYHRSGPHCRACNPENSYMWLLLGGVAFVCLYSGSFSISYLSCFCDRPNGMV